MKVNLLKTDLTNILNGYNNLSPHFTETKDSQIQGDILNLDWKYDGGEIEELLALNVIDFIQPNIIDVVITGWISKLKHGGQLAIGGLDPYLISKAFSSGALELFPFNQLLYGDQSSPWSSKKFIYGVDFLKVVFQQKGLRVLDIRIDGLNYVVSGQRP